jgi:hypothetical protein
MRGQTPTEEEGKLEVEVRSGLEALQSPAVLEKLELAQRELAAELNAAKGTSAPSEQVLGIAGGDVVKTSGHQIQGWSEFGEEDIADVGMHFMTKLVVTVGDLIISIVQDPEGDHIGMLYTQHS